MISSVDPLSKLAIALIWIIVLSICERPLTLAIIASSLLALLFLDVRTGLRPVLFSLLPFAFFALSSTWIYALAPNPAYADAEGGWAVGALIGARIMTIGLVSVTFALTTNMADLARVLVQRARLPRRFVFGALAAIQFIPALADDARTARMIGRAAISQHRTSQVRRIQAFFVTFRPGIVLLLMAGAIRRASAAAIAMELRGLGSAELPLTWRVPEFTRRDAAFMAVALLLIAFAWMAASL